MTKSRKSLTELRCGEFEGYVLSMGVPKYRAGQLRKWIYHNLAQTYEEMTDLPLAFCQKMAGESRLHSLEMIQQIKGRDGTVKALFQLTDGKTVEAALMFYDEEEAGRGDRRTVCVSTQAGCAVGCAFCATGQQGFDRNLTPGEIIDQVLYFARYLKDQAGDGGADKAERVSNVVFMGMGEPLANYDALWRAIEILNDPQCLGLGARNITISTAGMVPQIRKLSDEKMQVGLAVSLHAADNALRDRLVPLNRQYPVEELIQACREYNMKTGRRLSFEYILFNRLNDSPEQARRLAALIKGIKCHVNLIPANTTGTGTFQPPPYTNVLLFENELKANHVNVTLREKRGQDIEAGCGQLKSRYLKENQKTPSGPKIQE
jgi:23S rRNA (adenine2503-C2)-methyltransferase